MKIIRLLESGRMGKMLFVLGWVVFFIGLIWFMYQGFGSFFHQDDVILLGHVARWEGLKSLFHLNNEHLNITFYLLLRLEWLVFGVNFAGFLGVNYLLHILDLIMIFLIVRKITKSGLIASLMVWEFGISVNWFVVLWSVIGQMMLLCLLTALISYWLILKMKEVDRWWMRVVLLICLMLPGMSWGVGLFWPLWPLLVYGIEYRERRLNKVGVITLLALFLLLGFYFSIVGSNLGVHTDPWSWLGEPIKIFEFVMIGSFFNVLGRLVFPLDIYRVRALGLLIVGGLLVFDRFWRRVNREVLFGLVALLGSFVVFGIPRWRFGLGHAMIHYYGYFPLAFVLIGLGAYLAKSNWSRLINIVVVSFLILVMPLQWMAFQTWSNDWIVRPQQTREYFEQLNEVEKGECVQNDYLPKFVIPQERWRVEFIWPVFKKDFDPISESCG